MDIIYFIGFGVSCKKVRVLPRDFGFCPPPVLSPSTEARIDSGTKKSGYPPGFRVCTHYPTTLQTIKFLFAFLLLWIKGRKWHDFAWKFFFTIYEFKILFFFLGFCSKDVAFLQFFNSIHFNNIMLVFKHIKKLYYLKTRRYHPSKNWI